jgi:hypothetical protein
MHKLEIIFPDVTCDTEKLIDKMRIEFLENVIKPFNNFFEGYIVKSIDDISNQGIELTQESTYGATIAYGYKYSPFDRNEEGTAELYLEFFIDGKAEMSGPYTGMLEREKKGSWEEILIEALESVKSDLIRLNDKTKIDKISKVMKFLCE